MSGEKINWDNLRVFLAVARAQTALEAAKQVGMNHSTITRRLQRLEREMDTRLFSRTTQGHALTPAGHRLLEHVERIESTLAAADADVGHGNQLLAGQVRVGATEGFGSHFLAPQLAGFCARHPNLVVELLAVPRFVNLSKREADLAVYIERPQSGAYVVTRLTNYRLRLYATRNYLRRNPPVRKKEDLIQHNFVGYVDDLSFSKELNYLEQICPGAKVPLRSTSIFAQQHAVRRGCGIGILPCFTASQLPDLVPVLPDRVVVDRTFWLISPTERREIARVRALWSYLQRAAALNEAYLMGKTAKMTLAA